MTKFFGVLIEYWISKDDLAKDHDERFPTMSYVISGTFMNTLTINFSCKFHVDTW